MRFPICGARSDRLLPKLPSDYFQLLNANIQCSAEEAQSIYNKFRALAPFGRLDLTSFQECLGLFGTLGRLMAERIFRAFDLNNDGYLDFVEFSSSLLIMTKGSEEKKLALSYRILHPNPQNLPTALAGSLELGSLESRTPASPFSDVSSLRGGYSAESPKSKIDFAPRESIASNFPENADRGNSASSEAKSKAPSEASSSISFIRRTTETIINTTKIITSNITEMGQDKAAKPDAPENDEGIQFGEFVDVVNDIALTRALLVCREPRYYTNDEIRKVFQKYASVSSEGIQRLTQSDYTNAVCESSEFLEFLGVSLSQYAMESVSSSYKGVNLFMQKINATTLSYINRTKVKRKNVYKWINNTEAKRGLSVHFGHESWNHVVNMMIGLSISGRYVYSQPERPLCDEDYNVKLCFEILENYQGLNVTKYVTNYGLSSSRLRNMNAYNALLEQKKGGNFNGQVEHLNIRGDSVLFTRGRTSGNGSNGDQAQSPEDQSRSAAPAADATTLPSEASSANVSGTSTLKSGTDKDNGAKPNDKSLRIVENKQRMSSDDVVLSYTENFSTSSLNIISNMSNSSLLSSDVDFRFNRFYKDNLTDPSNARPSTYAIKSKIVFKEYAPMVFRQIRKMSGISEKDYIQSVSPEQIVGNMVLGNLTTMSELVSEGKSGALFYYTINGRLILKTVTKSCAKFVKGWLKSYYAHLEKSPNSILTRFYGLFSLQNLPTASGHSNQRLKKTYFVVMNNVFYSRVSIHRRFDLKGSWVGRTLHPSELKDPTVALKDVDFDRVGEFILLGTKGSEFMELLRNDVIFLQRSNLLDYSLLLGVHYRDQSRDKVNWDQDPDSVPGDQHRAMATDRTRIYYMGIVDLLTPWDFGKRLEHVWRVIQTRDHLGVSCVNPDHYSARFIQFISNHLK